MVRARVTYLWAAIVSSSAALALAAVPDVTEKPSQNDVQMAMDKAFAEANSIRDRTDLLWGDCIAVTHLQCTPARQGRSTCTYAYGHGRAVAILEKNEAGSWRWISGPYRCSIGVISK